PTFHLFASAWLSDRNGEVSQRTHEYERWALHYHLLPYFANWRLAEIDIEAVDGYRRYKVQQAERRGAAIEKGKPTRDERGRVLSNLLWRDIDLANGRIHIGRSKTQAGLREIPLLPLLRDELAARKAGSYRSGPEDPVFPTGTGGVRDKDNLRNRVLAAAI